MRRINPASFINFVSRWQLKPNVKISHILTISRLLWPFVTSNELSLLIPRDVQCTVYALFMDLNCCSSSQPVDILSGMSQPCIPSSQCWQSGPEKNETTTSLMYMQFVTFHNVLSLVWIGPRLPFLQRPQSQIRKIWVSSPLIQVSGYRLMISIGQS